MSKSFRRRYNMAIVVASGIGVLVSGFIVLRFQGYEQSVSRLLSGDQRTVLMAHVIGAKVKAAQEMVDASVTREESNQVFQDRIKGLTEEVGKLAKESSESAIGDAQKNLEGILNTKSEAMEDLFVHYRNIKTSAFNLYRLAWNNKWMGVAKSVGIVISDLDNLPYHSGDKAVQSIGGKLGQVVAQITSSPISQDGKMLLMGQLGVLKNQLSRYSEVFAKAEKIRVKRLDDLKAAEVIVTKYSEKQSRGMVDFTSVSHRQILFAWLAFFLLLGTSLLWYLVSGSMISTQLHAAIGVVRDQFSAWAANMSEVEFRAPEQSLEEFRETYAILEQTVRKANLLRHEDEVVKKLILVPFALVRNTKQTVFWNSALAHLAKTRSLSELGSVGYVNLLRFKTAQGKAIDPIEKAFTDRKEVVQLALLVVGDDAVAVQATCTPLVGSDGEVEYVAIHLRDLRDENRRMEAEIDRQLDWVQRAIAMLGVDAAADRLVALEKEAQGAGARAIVIQSLKGVEKVANENTERASVLRGQIETMQERMTREAELKKNVHQRTESLRNELNEVRQAMEALVGVAHGLMKEVSSYEKRNAQIKNEYLTYRKQSQQLVRDLKACVGTLNQSIEVIQSADSYLHRARSSEQILQGVLNDASLLNARNSILGSKKDFGPGDASQFTESVAQLLSRIERGHRVVQDSVSGVELGVKTLGKNLRSAIDSCTRLLGTEANTYSKYEASVVDIADSADQSAITQEQLDKFFSKADDVRRDVSQLESKLGRLVQIGQASIELQTYLESGFRGMRERTLSSQA